MCGKYEDFKTYFVGQKSEPKEEKGKLISPVRFTAQDQADMENTWNPGGIYKNWFGYQIEEEKCIEFMTDNKKFGLRPFQENYIIRKANNRKYTDSIIIKTKCVAITPSGLENVKTHAAGIWKIEALY